MSQIKFLNVRIDIPIFNAFNRSLKTTLLNLAVGRKLTAIQNKDHIVTALKDLNFTFSKGERVGLLGNNGAGKTTLLRALSGVYHPTQGHANIQGKVSSLIDISLGIDNEATGRENIVLRSALLGLSKKEVYEKIENIIEFSELGDFIDMPVRTYSSGMQLRLAFSVSTLISTEILLMDEWLSVGDENFKHKAEKRLMDLVHESEILVIASHSRHLIETTCNRALWLEHGVIKMDGSPNDVCSAYFA